MNDSKWDEIILNAILKPIMELRDQYAEDKSLIKLFNRALGMLPPPPSVYRTSLCIAAYVLICGYIHSLIHSSIYHIFCQTSFLLSSYYRRILQFVSDFIVKN